MQRETNQNQTIFNSNRSYYDSETERNQSFQDHAIATNPINEMLLKLPQRDKCNLDQAEINSLFEKKEELQRFIDRIGDTAYLPIREDIRAHCQRISPEIIPKNMTKEKLMVLIKNRVEKMIKNKRIKKNWSSQDLKILIWVISKYCQFQGIQNVNENMGEADWNRVATLIPGVTGKSCMFKWLSLKKNNLSDNSWHQDQSLLLDQMVNKYGQNNWCKVSQELFIKNQHPNKIYRCPKQCREHWNCYLNPCLKKGPWSREQDYLLLRSVFQLQGIKKWAEIVKFFNGRTQNALKNRFNLIVDKQKQSKDKKKNSNIADIDIIKSYLKKHQHQFSIDSNTLRLLYSIRNQMSESKGKKQPKKTKNKKLKRQEQLNDDNDDFYYRSSHFLSSPKQTRSSKSKITHISSSSFEEQVENNELVERQEDRQEKQEKQEIYIRQQSMIVSCQSAFSYIYARNNDPIFQPEEENIQIEEVKQEEREKVKEEQNIEVSVINESTQKIQYIPLWKLGILAQTLFPNGHQTKLQMENIKSEGIQTKNLHEFCAMIMKNHPNCYAAKMPKKEKEVESKGKGQGSGQEQKNVTVFQFRSVD